MGIPKAIVDNVQAADNGRITACENDISALQATIALLLTDKANVSGQVFTGAVSATNLSGTNTGNQLAAAMTPAFGSANIVDAVAVTILGFDVVSLSDFNNRMQVIEDYLNELGGDATTLRSRLQAASPSALLGT